MMRKGIVGFGCAIGLLLGGCAAPLAGSVDPLGAGTQGSLDRWDTIGASRGGLPVRATTLGTGGARIAVIAGIHGDEQEGHVHLQEIHRLLAVAPVTARLIDDVNPDGTARNRRATIRGVDPNRNWPARTFQPSPRTGPAPLSEPGVRAVHDDLVRFDPQLVVVLHSITRGPFVNFDGPGEGFAERFVEAANASDPGRNWSVQPAMGYPTPGSLGQWMGVDRGVPILTVEFLRGTPPNETLRPLLEGLRAIIELGPAETRPVVR